MNGHESGLKYISWDAYCILENLPLGWVDIVYKVLHSL